MNIELLSRAQFAFTMSFHILFPALSIGLALFLIIAEGMWLYTKKEVYYQICRFWVKVFALTFGMGVVSGIVMEFQLGTNWAGFVKQVGGVLGPLFVYEVMTAFFIEAGALGIMIFGWNKVGRKLHYLSTILVMLGTLLSAYWIMSANTWMQHPVGYSISNNKFYVTSWYDIIFNNSTMPRFLHMLFASYTAAFFTILGISAYYIAKQKHLDFAKISFKIASFALIIMMPLQIYLGDEAGLVVHKTQPIKTAAMEGLWETKKGVPLLLFALPNQSAQKNSFEIGIPYLTSIINTHSLDGELIGLKTVSPADQPPVWLVFFSFRVMVGIGLLMLMLAISAFYLSFKNRFTIKKQQLFKIFTFASPLGFFAILFGWFTAEFGRQPWVVYGLIRTRDAVSHISFRDTLISLILIIIVYGIIFGYFYFYFLIKTVKQGPKVTQGKNEPFDYMASPLKSKEDIK